MDHLGSKKVGFAMRNTILFFYFLQRGIIIRLNHAFNIAFFQVRYSTKSLILFFLFRKIIIDIINSSSNFFTKRIHKTL